MGTYSNGEVGPLLSSLNRGGTPKTASEARDDDLVDIGGHSTTVANAVRLFPNAGQGHRLAPRQHPCARRSRGGEGCGGEGQPRPWK